MDKTSKESQLYWSKEATSTWDYLKNCKEYIGLVDKESVKGSAMYVELEKIKSFAERLMDKYNEKWNK